MKRKARTTEGPPAAGAASVVPPVTHTIDLEPGDWMRATWRPRTPLARPLVGLVPFDPDACRGLLARALADRSRTILWTLGDRPWSRQEAHFWLVALTADQDRVRGPELVDRVSRMTFTGLPSV